ncbi:Asp-tRNA(Asn)/Glu-tRNA(Gln) amidotransferase subunit GatB [Anoxynatronum buryatiense]|uniref:Aspartyl/glutamyl-tRNA(Asn/Gln) amidotransferase subunit B n=1 Tax=Anoxynatronum buryatiense TaxID=489973 RepID=A0AA46AJQ4_9CLOT|nr:Asp-tRNA(Asn)/Glu-tRNA(Gln) amidotransferase subunit GatB [Anoxynatronum buryatiense]SMP64789.1 aspartyl/glutamyl-tRNA(Asn/Gln) amidotransferase subunit B [Anoxynatronum buryatiense]
MKWETVIGLEIHAELDTKTKIFCDCPTAFGAAPNQHTCPVCMGLPGTLPVLNQAVVDMAVKAGLALGCEVQTVSKMDRKNYFYPDLPKAYQISQYDLPICTGGSVEIEVNGEKKTIRIHRIHIEEDAGKLIHDEYEPLSYIDYNRVGVPLIEIVSEADMRSPEEAVAYLRAVRAVLQYAGVSDCRMEQGSLRCDGNISLRPYGQEALNEKVELKNINSFKELQKALEKEEKRQMELYSFGEGHKVVQETRRWDAAKGRTISMRTKEDAHDYRYFPEPDLKPILIPEAAIEAARSTLPELPAAKAARFSEAYGLTPKEIAILTGEKALSRFFEETVAAGAGAKAAANWILGDLLRCLKETDIEAEDQPLQAVQLAKLIELVEAGTISGTVGKEVFQEMYDTGKDPEAIVEEKGLKQISGSGELAAIISQVLAANPASVEDYHSGKKQALGFLMGQVMKATGGQANPKMAKEMLEKALQA